MRTRLPGRRLAIPAALMGGALLAFLPGAPQAPAGEKTAAAATLRVGLAHSLFPDDPEKQIEALGTPLKSLMEEQGGVVGQVSGGDCDELVTHLKEDKVQLGVFQGYEFAWARLKAPDLKPLMIAAYHRPFARAVLVVRQDDKATDAADLKGKVLSLPRLARGHCRLFVERHCVKEGDALEKWFAKVSTPNTVRDALDDVAEGRAGAAAVDDVELSAFRKAYPKTAARLRVLQESEPFPCIVIAYRPGAIPDDVLKGLRLGLLAAKATSRGRDLMEMCRITAFEPVPDDFEQALDAIAKAYPPATK